MVSSPQGQKEIQVDPKLLKREEKEGENLIDKMGKSSRQVVEKKGQVLQCYECHGYGYVVVECPSTKKKDIFIERSRGLKAKVSESESEFTSNDDSSSQSDEENFIAFVCSHATPLENLQVLKLSQVLP